MKNSLYTLAIAHCLILSACTSFGQVTNKKFVFVIENRKTHEKFSFVEGNKLRIDLEHMSVRGKIMAIADSSITIRHWGQEKLIDQNIKINSIVSLARAKKTGPVVWGSILLFSGALTFVGGASLANEPDPPGLVIFSNRDVGEMEMILGGVLIAGGIPLVVPRKKYRAQDWNFYTLETP
jgi:hypothetical protein